MCLQVYSFIKHFANILYIFSHIPTQKEARDWVLGIIETGHLEKPCRRKTENIAPCFCIQSSTHRTLRLSVYKTSRSCILTTPRSDWFLHQPAVKFSRFRFRGTEPKTLLYVGHRSQGELCRCEDTQFFGNQLLHGANFLLYIFSDAHQCMLLFSHKTACFYYSPTNLHGFSRIFYSCQLNLDRWHCFNRFSSWIFFLNMNYHE